MTKRTITDEIINKVKELSANNSQRTIASKLYISQYTVWAIMNGKYDSGLPIQHDRVVYESYFIHQ